MNDLANIIATICIILAGIVLTVVLIRLGVGPAHFNDEERSEPFIGENPAGGPRIPGITNQPQDATGPVWFR